MTRSCIQELPDLCYFFMKQTTLFSIFFSCHKYNSNFCCCILSNLNQISCAIPKMCFSSILQVGFDALYFSRIDYQDRIKRKNLKNLEVVWRGSKSLSSSADVSTLFPLRNVVFCIAELDLYLISFVVFCSFMLNYQVFPLKHSKIFLFHFQIFTGIFPQNYEPPPGGFYFEINDDSPVIQVSLF